jgi:hypothetical protein
MEGFRNYYNFIRPHQTLHGKMPAEVAGLNLGIGENRGKGFDKEKCLSTK